MTGVREDLLAALRSAPSGAAALKLMFAIEDALTPPELAGALPELRAMTGPAGAVVAGSPAVALFEREAAEPYTQESVAAGATFYRGAADPAGRGLLVVLSGRHPRPMIAIPIFLQQFPARLFDVLLLFDETNAHYADGVAGLGDSLPALTRRVHEEFGARGYARIYHYGVSSGGLPALRMGLMAPAHRSVAIGGLFPWPINRLRAGAAVSAFDPICQCNAGRGGGLVCVHGAVERDIGHARRVVRLLGARGVRINDAPEHNVLFPLLQRGQFKAFHQRLLGFSHGADGAARFVDGFGV